MATKPLMGLKLSRICFRQAWLRSASADRRFRYIAVRCI